MGDIFDFLCEEIEYFNKINDDLISLINTLSNKIEIIYLEGNHDFNLKNIFPNITVIKRENQPLYIKNKDKTIAVSHGDIFTPKGYDIYCNIFRNHYFLKTLNLLDINNFISKYSENKLKNKKICSKQDNFTDFVKNRIIKYNIDNKVDLIIEGHFHQGCADENYINIPSLCCDKRYMIFKDDKFILTYL